MGLMQGRWSCRRLVAGSSIARRAATDTAPLSTRDALAAASNAPSPLRATASRAALPERGLGASTLAAPHAPPPEAADGLASPAPDYPHVSVMLREVLAAFQPVALRVFLDGTLGAGGHSAALVAAHPEMRSLFGIDLDPTAHALAGPRIAAAAAGREEELAVRLLHGNYRDLHTLLSTLSGPRPRPDGILLDLGVSSMQIDTAERGFSFMRDGPLDMRMDPSASISAEELLNSWSEADLGRIIRDYGEEKLWKVVAKRLVQARELEPIRTTHQLAKAVGHTQIGGKLGRGGRGPGKGEGKGKGVHPATRTFQALRIAVNDELGKLEEALPYAIEALAPGGRLAVISFHSLEDRIVKHAFCRAIGKPTPEQEPLTYGPGKYDFLEALEASKVATLVTRKPSLPSDDECAANPRARSAKLRVLQKL
ncbi:Ribosomal RNA small subunit methyltransferase H [Tetrabaena socialis]|uniref:Ribosomal RNA small subunit methyltransferase H n=1 Tax=Tetrabaena socialis TaxID=47790 RepID=A0A2J7ZUS9_9CHLO|nr:Ribosomal RNA small subunit methyltransferase H [Tetrabaena socialis]|eukprot:PNH04008.1 Ribosomal RNA small subunit methyltransferase H [Tetrabaena socialis]